DAGCRPPFGALGASTYRTTERTKEADTNQCRQTGGIRVLPGGEVGGVEGRFGSTADLFVSRHETKLFGLFDAANPIVDVLAGEIGIASNPAGPHADKLSNVLRMAGPWAGGADEMGREGRHADTGRRFRRSGSPR